MEYQEEDFIMLSGIQHYAFCRRQWALIHIEQQWLENEYTVEGDIFHSRAHDKLLYEKRNNVIISRGMPIFSRTLGASGICDIVEFHMAEDGVPLYGHRGLFRIYPIEYKKGRPKDTEIDILQLAAQAMCLEEMLSAVIEEGALYYGEIRRREKIAFTEELRERVRASFQEMHQLYQKKYTPKVKWYKSCNACSLRDICLPKLGKATLVRDYIRNVITEDGDSVS